VLIHVFVRPREGQFHRTNDGTCVTPCQIAVGFKFLAITNLTHFFHIFIYFMSLHVSSVTALIIRRSNCINTSSGMISLCK